MREAAASRAAAIVGLVAFYADEKDFEVGHGW
jgi:hypothetical protein